LTQTGRIEEGRNELTRIPADSEHYSSALWAITECHELQNEFTQAAESAARLCALMPNEASTHCNLGHLLCQMDDYTQAIEVLERALEISPKHLDSLFNQAVAFTCLGRFEEAIQRYEQRNQVETGLSKSGRVLLHDWRHEPLD